MVSRQAPTVVWLESLRSSNPAVKAYVRRNKLEYPDQRFLDHGDVFDAYATEFAEDKERHKDGFFVTSCVPKKHGDVGTVYPRMLELDDIHGHVLSGVCASLIGCVCMPSAIKVKVSTAINCVSTAINCVRMCPVPLSPGCVP
jgi:hypothetical protein